MKRLTFVSGKGGVGKTTTSLALAIRSAQQGHKVLLIETHSEEQVAQLLGRPPIGYEETLLLPRLYGINIHPKKSFEEYVLTQIPKMLYRAIFENRFVRNFIDATPGLAPLMIIGKICSLLDRYDNLIVDAPATGHGLAMFQIAAIVARAARIGPLKTHAGAIDERLKDSQQTGIILVTLPEELPVSETLEMTKRLRAEGYSLDQVVLNQFVKFPLIPKEKNEFEKLPSRQSAPFGVAMEIEMRRADRSHLYREKLKSLKIPLLEIPYRYASSFGLEEVETLAQML